MGLRNLLHGPPPALPRVLDRVVERWARQPPRVRLAAWAMLLVVGAGQCSGYRDGLTARWGGEGVLVWQAERTIPAGEDPGSALRRVRLPPVAVPASALTEAPSGRALVLPLLEGAVLTRDHLSPVGLSQSLPPGQRLVPIPVEASWGIEPGVLVDIWAFDPRAGEPVQLSQGRPVLAVTEERGRGVALLALAEDEVRQVTAALGSGQVRLTLGPPPLD